MTWLDRFSVRKLADDLDYWLMIGIADDIVELPGHRPEYQHLVARYGEPSAVLVALRYELTKPWYRRETFWRLVRLNLRFWPHTLKT